MRAVAVLLAWLAPACVVPHDPFVGYACDAAHDCADGSCVDGVCAPACDDDEECEGSRICRSRGCVVPRVEPPPGASVLQLSTERKDSGDVGLAGCPAAARQFGLVADPPTAGALISNARQDGSVVFCAEPATAPTPLGAAVVVVTVPVENTSGSNCTVTASLLGGADNALASASLDVPSGFGAADGRWQMDAAAGELGESERLALLFSWEPVKACNDTAITWGGGAGALEIPWALQLGSDQ